MNLKILKKLARSNKYQLIYGKAKELSNIRLFKNEGDFSKIQLMFLSWLGVYNMLYSDLNMNENYISEAVIKDELRTEAYLLYKEQKSKEKDNLPQVDNKVIPSNVPTLIFTKKKKK